MIDYAKLKIVLNNDIKISPKSLAIEFCDMDGDEMAEFFNEIKKQTQKWARQFCFQAQFINDSDLLDEGGREIMATIGEYAR